MTTYTEDAWTRIEQANTAAGWSNDWTVAERDQIEALADDLNRGFASPARASQGAVTLMRAVMAQRRR